MPDTDGYPTEEAGGREVPSPGRWRVNWGTGQVVSWYYGEKTRDATYAHFFDCSTARYIEVGDERFDLDDVDRPLLNAHIARILRENAPDTS